MIFDLLELDGLEAWRLPYEKRRALLEQLVEDGPTWTVTPSVRGGGDGQLDLARSAGREGIMAKRLDGVYRPGSRSDTWRKVKIRHAQEFVVCGWTPGEGHRTSGIGALVLGCHEQGVLRWVGNVGTGFTSAESDRWRTELEESATDTAPFDTASIDEWSRHPALRGVRWSVPRFVVQVAYSEWTRDRRLRQASLLGRRPDVDPGAVRCEE